MQDNAWLLLSWLMKITQCNNFSNFSHHAGSVDRSRWKTSKVLLGSKVRPLMVTKRSISPQTSNASERCCSLLKLDLITGSSCMLIWGCQVHFKEPATRIHAKHLPLEDHDLLYWSMTKRIMCHPRRALLQYPGTPK